MNLDQLSGGLGQPGLRAAALLVLVILILGRIPILKFLILPFSILAVLVHELAHVVVTILTGGTVRSITVTYNTARNEVEGETRRIGGDGCLIGNAGYLGTILAGAALLIIAISDVSARAVLLLLGGLLLLMTPFIVRGAFAIISTLLIGAGFILIGRQFPEVIAKGVLWIAAVTMVVDSALHLIYIPGDARNLHKRTGIDFGVWIVLWQVLAVIIVLYALNRAYGVPLPWTLLGT